MGEPIVKIFNKGKRVIDDIQPDAVVEVSESRAKQLQRLFSAEIIIVADGQDPHAAANSDSAKCAALKKDIVGLNKKIEALQKSDNAEVVEDLQKEIEELKADKEKLSANLKKAQAEIKKLKPKN